MMMIMQNAFKEFEEFEVLQKRDSHLMQKHRKRSYILLQASLKPDSFWVEYSTMLFDRKGTEFLIREAEMSVESILPPPAGCWTVIQDLTRCLPGKCEDDSVCYY
jgi:hypothetical protein